MLDLESAIKHCEEMAEKNEEMCRVKELMGLGLQNTEMMKCARTHKQLAEWLIELKQLREQEPILGKIKAEIGMYEADCRLQGGTDECEKCNSNIFGSIYRIIDKYMAESEVEE